MVTISKKEYIIYRQIKTLSLEYENKIPLNILKMELEIYKEYLENVLNLLTNKGIIIHENNGTVKKGWKFESVKILAPG